MTKELTKEEIARVFSFYWDAPVLLLSVHNELKPMGYVDSRIMMSLKDTDIVFKLRLKPLSKITDEHAIEVCKSFYQLCFNGKCKNGWQVEKDKMYPDEFLNITHKDNDFFFVIDKIDGNITLYRSEEYDSGGCNVDAVDKLRELGYALPYKGKSLFELGIAIEYENQLK